VNVIVMIIVRYWNRLAASDTRRGCENAIGLVAIGEEGWREGGVERGRGREREVW
jgi:hypothetical protein